MSMQIRSIVIYNSAGETRELSFKAGVNIITGESNTGKSALIDIVEYCLGRSEFEVPGEVIRNTVVWYGVLYEIGGTQVFIAKQPPPLDLNRQTRAHYEENPETFPPPMAILSADTNDDEINQNLSRLLRSSLKSHEESNFNEQLRTSVNFTNYYLFQKSSVIGNDVILFHRQEEDSKTIKETLPYFLGIVGEENLKLTRELEEASRDYRRISAKFNEAKRRIDDIIRTGQNLVDEAQRLGIVNQDVILQKLDDVNEISEILSEVLSWQPSTLPPVSDDRLPQLRQEWNEIRQEFGRKQEEINEAKLLQKEIAGYSSGTDEQRLRLQSINLFAHQDTFDVFDNPSMCPICSSQISDDFVNVPKMAVMRQSLIKLEENLKAVKREQPQLTHFIQGLEQELEQIRRRLLEKQMAMDAVLQELRVRDSIIQQIRDANSRIDRLVGRVELYLEIVNSYGDAAMLAEQREAAKNLLDDYEKQSNKFDIERNERRILNRISDQMTEWATRLNLTYKGRYWFDSKNLNVVVDTAERSIPMKEIGGNRNYLGCHLITLLSLHKQFISNPVPNFIILDQPAQGYFPSKKAYEAIQNTEDTKEVAGNDIIEVQNMFDFLFEVCENLAPDFQIIVLEHANLEDNRFQQALIDEPWIGGRKLVPQSWYSDNSEYKQIHLI